MHWRLMLALLERLISLKAATIVNAEMISAINAIVSEKDIWKWELVSAFDGILYSNHFLLNVIKAPICRGFCRGVPAIAPSSRKPFPARIRSPGRRSWHAPDQAPWQVINERKVSGNFITQPNYVNGQIHLNILYGSSYSFLVIDWS